MYIICQNPFGHFFNMGHCYLCGVQMCLLCNPGNQCGNGCALPMQLVDIDGGKNEVLVFDEGDGGGGHDALVVNDEFAFGYIRDVELEDSRDVRFYHVIFECVGQVWFARLADDLSDLPPWTTVAQAASFCIIDLCIAAGDLRAIAQAVGQQHFFRGNWVELTINRNQDPGDDRPRIAIDIYLPPAGELNPANTGIDPSHAGGWFLRNIAPVPDTDWGLRKLRRLSQGWAVG